MRPTAPEPRFLVIGECVADIVRTPGRPDRTHPGGSPANVAYGLARLGRRAALVTQLGADADGELIRAHLGSAGVEVLTAGDGARTPAAVVTLDAEGHASYAFEIGWTLSAVAVPFRPDHVHIGSIAAVTEPGADTVLAQVESVRSGASVSYDPNVRPALMGDHSRAVARVERCVALSDLVKASDQDLDWLYPGQPYERIAERWLDLGPGTVLVTRGGAGSLALGRQGRAEVAARAVTVADTVGAGDSYTAATLDAMARLDALGSANRARPAGWDAGTLARIARYAGAAASVTVSRAGANPPDAAELRSAMGGAGLG
ncbi:carbohydrate kinase [Kitasatospora sp. NBC_00315]|uniref:carbohydrate kinase family protein n=1 Tax=Kitasatospora sp. NBC_00315 TaxID=2975963 RepID=UPI00325512BD